MTAALLEDAVALAKEAAPRAILGLTGPPAAGKSTLATHLVDEVNRRLGPDTAAYLPMDGFHLSNLQLQRMGRQNRKGAPDTFDVHGYVALLHRVTGVVEHDIYVPSYDRTLHEPIAARLVVAPETKLVITEGNYLASDESVWREVRKFLRALWYIETADEVRESRLAERQITGGRNHDEAWAWVESNDRPNGEVVKKTRDNCTRVVVPGTITPAP
ncbi:nucleoside/nucleotide kinase family protein [Streptomyces sannanensis]|uniref:Nucleoside/nucleotide kinase family protein n=1 Tax=Streptomyces sannanensis TaxID=285536 RepID=A0ABP6SAU3_9ACTN